MNWRSELLRAYPRSWRAEYGEGLAGILAGKRASCGVVVDVVGGAAREHLHRDPPWILCGIALLFLSLLAGATGLPSIEPWLLVGCGAWTVARQRTGQFAAMRAAVLASWIGFLPALLMVFYPHLWRHVSYFITGVPHLIPLAYLEELLVLTTLVAAGCGALGGLTAQFVLGIQEGLREA